MQLNDYLSKKPLYYKNIDYERFPKVYQRVKEYFTLPKIVHVIGTNAKGSTGRALAHLLYKSGKNVGHYSSPHILKFNERVWINGKDIDEESLEKAHEYLQKILLKKELEELSYFEYTTLLAMHLFCKECDYIVLEAGLGGEYDATNAFAKILSVVTVIGMDHEAFLGESIEEIAKTKLRSINNDAIIAKQNEDLVYDLAHEQVKKIKKNLLFSASYFDSTWYDSLEEWLKRNNYPLFFKENFSSAFCAFSYLGFEADIELLDGLKLFGRCQKIRENITIDVGHNPLGAWALREHFRDKKVKLVYNSYNDKEFEKILSILKPIVEEVLILPIQNSRSILEAQLEATLEELFISYSYFEAIEEDKEYLVFGSFSVVEAFLKGKIA